MRSIQELLQDGHWVWFYLKDQKTQEKFVEEVNQLGARYLNGTSITNENCTPVMAVRSDLCVAHLMILIWNASFTPSFQEHYAGDTSKILKVDYAKYVSENPDYLCHRSMFIPTV